MGFKDYQAFRLCVFLCFYFFFADFFIFYSIPLIGVFLRGEKFFFWVWFWVNHPNRGAFFYALLCYFLNIFTFWCGNSFSLFLPFVLFFFFLCFLSYLIYTSTYLVGYFVWVVQGGSFLTLGGGGSFTYQFRPDFLLAIICCGII